MGGLRARPRALVAVTSIACGWWVSGLQPFSTEATVVVLAAGVASMAVGRVQGRPPSGPGARGIATMPWIALLTVLAGWQLAAYASHPRSDHPTLSSLANGVLDPRPVRALAFAGWMLAAGWLARR